ncbi:hypothetical protein C0431_04785 [bacterium]|jgi:polyisoprenoid-binding protein YceI|nr:hypothetical protein [bacterium]
MVAKTALFALAASALVAPTFAPAPYDFKDPKGVNGLTFAVDSPLEPIFGTTDAVSGNIQFDPAHPEKTTGKITVETAKVKAASQGMTDAMQGDWCLNPQKHPAIEFEIVSLSNTKEIKKGVFESDVKGKFTLNGITKDLTVKATATHLPDALAARGGVPGKKGDLVVVRTKFSFNRLDHNLAPDLNQNVIGNKVDIDLAAVGYTIK